LISKFFENKILQNPFRETVRIDMTNHAKSCTLKAAVIDADRLRFEQTAAQVLAAINADWHRPTLEQIEFVLDRAKSQARDAAAIKELRSEQTPAPV
jgi:hypothetical protein